MRDKVMNRVLRRKRFIYKCSSYLKNIVFLRDFYVTCTANIIAGY